jgi:hypothetical protein
VASHLCPKNLCHPRGSPHNFRPTSVQFKSRINSDKARKRHQTRHLEFYTPQLLTEGLQIPTSLSHFDDEKPKGAHKGLPAPISRCWLRMVVNLRGIFGRSKSRK